MSKAATSDDRDDDLVAHIRGELAAISGLPAIVEDFGSRHGLPPALVATLNLVLEELVANTVSHGYDGPDDDHPERFIDIRLSCRGNVVTMQVEDDARPFDPTQLAAPDIDAPLEEREPGGLGIHFIRTLMDTVEYRHVAGRNRVTLTKTIQP